MYNTNDTRDEMSDLCRLPRASLSDKDKALMACDDIAEAFLVLPHWKLQPLLQDLIETWCVR